MEQNNTRKKTWLRIEVLYNFQSQLAVSSWRRKKAFINSESQKLSDFQSHYTEFNKKMERGTFKEQIF